MGFVVVQLSAQERSESIPTERDNVENQIPASQDCCAGEASRAVPGSTDLADAPSACRSAWSNQNPLTFQQRARIFGRAVIRPYSLVGPAWGAGIRQWENQPPEWGQGAEGYAHRFGSGLGRHLISETLRFGVAAVDGEDPRYHRSEESAVWSRTRYAIAETFTSHTASGARVPAYSRFVAVYGAAFISNSWYPDSRATPAYALRRGSTALASSLGFHLFQEFLPRKMFKALHVQP